MQFADQKAKLTQRRDELTARLRGIETELESHHNPDWEDLALEREDDEVLESMGQMGQGEMRQITAALARIDDGSYGDCARCGTQIDDRRLALLPHTPFCAGCAR
jgi:RNA polymerase-binding transcription factor DksA